MTIEFAGAVDVRPPLTTHEIAYVRRLAEDIGGSPMAWDAAAGGSDLRPQEGADVDDCVESMRQLLLTMELTSRFRGMVAAYDSETRELTAITVSRGRVSRRRLFAPTGDKGRLGTNVVDLAARRRAVSRAIS